MGVRSKGLAFISLFAIGLASVASAHAEQRFDGVVLRVATFGGSNKDVLDAAVSPKFAALGGKIEWVTGSPQSNLAKLIAARGKAPFDTMEILDAQLPDFAASDFLAPLDLEKIPNKQYLEDWQYDGKTMATWLTQETICYNTEKFKELGLPAPTTYKDLAVPALAGRTVIPDITSGGGLANFGGIVYAAGGDLRNVTPGLELIKSLKVLKFWSQGGETVTQFGSGDIYAAVVHAGWCVRAKNAGSPVQTVHPYINAEHTGVHKYGRQGVMKSSENYEAALWYINEYLSIETQTALAVKTGVFPTNKAVIARLGDDPTLKQMLELDPAKISKQLRVDYTDVSISDWVDQWNRSVVTN
ncbi:MAG: extracellular solute-binding protein [Pseudomonadota bacterium]|nr:extracellular solute-binding protein [Pseudomonadota bacterium]